MLLTHNQLHICVRITLRDRRVEGPQAVEIFESDGVAIPLLLRELNLCKQMANENVPTMDG